jgi:CNT family concentrative nucleoside transporter
MGIEQRDCMAAGQLLGVKMVANEFVAYLQMTGMKDAAGASLLSERTTVIMTYALCGFSNFSSIGIQLGGIGGMAPERRGDLAKLGLRAMLGGAIACCITACIAGMVL